MKSIGIYILLIALSAKQMTCANIEEEVEHISFLRPLLIEEEPSKVIEAYKEKMFNFFQYKIQSTGSLKDLLEELSNLTPAALEYINIHSGETDMLKKELQRFFNLNYRHFKNVEAPFTDFLLSAYVAFVREHDTFKAIDTNNFLNEQQIREYFGEFEQQRSEMYNGKKSESLDSPDLSISSKDSLNSRKSNLFLNQQSRDKFVNDLVKIRNDFVASKSSEFDQLLEFLESPNPNSSIKQLLESMALYYLQNSPQSIFAVAAKIASINAFLVKINGYELLHQFLLGLTKNVKQNSNLNKANFKVIFTYNINLFTFAIDDKDQLLGRDVFLDYFSLLEGQSEPCKEFKKFLIKKYKREQLKFETEAISSGYPDMIRLYTLDVLVVSLFTKEKFITKADFRYIFNNFEFFTGGFNLESLKFTKKMKYLFLSNCENLSEFYELFNSLYDTILLAGDYYSHTFLTPEWSNPFKLFDKFLDSLKSWEIKYISVIWKWQPNQDHFATNIQTNYFFYKFINLVENREFLEKGISFLKFDENDDVLIHKYTLLTKPKLLFEHLKNRLFPGTGFNYYRFSKLIVSSEDLESFEDNQTRRANFLKIVERVK